MRGKRDRRGGRLKKIKTVSCFGVDYARLFVLLLLVNTLFKVFYFVKNLKKISHLYPRGCFLRGRSKSAYLKEQHFIFCREKEREGGGREREGERERET